MRLLFSLLIIAGASAQAQTVIRLEYYFDSDPGFGNGVSIPINASTNLTQDFTIPLITVSEGVHNLYIRAKSIEGTWSIPVNKPVFVQYGSQTASIHLIDKLEYFVDTDPGIGNGISIPISAGTNLTHDFSISLAGTSDGFHTIYLRAKTNSGLWSHSFAKPVFVQGNSQSAGASPLKRIEYFLDIDPGFGNGAIVPVSSTVADQSVLIDLTSVAPGFHALYIRTQDTRGKWSLPLLKPFFVEKSGSDIIALEYYFFDGTNRTPVKLYSSFAPGKNIIIDFSASIDELLPNTAYEIHLVAINADDQRSKEITHTFVTPAIICDPITPPAATGATRCGAGNVDLVASGAEINQSYRWYTSANDDTPIAGVNGNTLTTPVLNSTTIFHVSILNGTCESLRTPVTATVLNSPSQPTISASEPVNAGIISICFQTITLSAPAGFISYQWSTGQTTQQITTGQFGSYSVMVADANGCNSISSDVVQVVASSTCVNNAPVINTTSFQTIIGGKVLVDLRDYISDPDGNLDQTSLRIVNNATQKGGKTTLTGFILEIDYALIEFSGEDLVTIRVCDLLNACFEADFSIEVIGDIIVYNGISPNGDDQNDAWIIEYIDLFPDTQKNKVTIYNRWGDVVWDASDYNNASIVFVGQNNNGNDLSTGSYFYKIEFPEGRETITGYLSLKR